ncbi:uncharacterized protein BDV17DRAFT_285393 [Aspergillus undulatus]|uniref:uncharacterized protein n=1 Tax=Aspergillus undulatus TaxID=1810928 RepID=UPI003CCD6201
MAATSRWLSLAGAIALLGTGCHAKLSIRDDIRVNLMTQLSENADIIFPDEEIFDNATERWSYYHPPSFTVVVEVAEEEDVAKAIRYANSQDLPFLAVNGGHGAISSLSNMDHGMQIWLHKLNSVVIAEDGQTATFGGGITSYELIRALYQEGKHTVHGVCECVSYLGPALGGGHGALQGKHGMASDQIVSLRLATADGEIITVSEDEGDEDLWWAVRGAGHNFGVVTSVTSKIFDVPDDGLWAHEQLLFTGDQAEDLFERFNDLADIQPPGFMVWTYLMRVPELNPENPVYIANFMREGVEEIEPGLIDPFRELSQSPALAKTTGQYTDIPAWINTAVGSRGCANAENKVRLPIGFPRYDVEAQKKFFDAFAEGTAGASQFNTSMVLIEQYSDQGVQAVPEESSAFPNRDDFLLVSPVIAYWSESGEVEEQAVEFGNDLRDILLEGTGSDELHAYVNYAAGDEGVRGWYGYEQWRIEKLQKVKRKNPVQEPPKVAVTPCEGEARYYFEGGLRRVHPYHYTYNTYCKERWRNRELIDIFTSEFRDREPGYYKKALESGFVTVNGKPAGPHTVLKNGEVISHTLHRHEPPVTGNPIGIIHETDDLLVIDKPAGVPVHSTGRYHFNSVMEILRIQNGGAYVPRPCNRLDRLTSGVMFFGKTREGADNMTVKLRERSVQKEYVARVKGRFPDGVVVVDQPIMSVSPKVGLNRARATGKEAKTKFRRLAYYPPSPSTAAPTTTPTKTEGENKDSGDRPATPPPSYINESAGYSIVHCLPLTGRTHQIRVHLQFLGHPITNDPIYSNRKVFGPTLGANDTSSEHDQTIIDRLMQMGRTELPDTVAANAATAATAASAASYKTLITTPPILPPGTDNSVAEAIMTKEHEAMLARYEKVKGERLSGQKCDVCGTELYTDPGVHELGIFLHAVAYADNGGEWKYRSKMPSWALPPHQCEGPTEVPEWEDVSAEEEFVVGDGVVREFGNEGEETTGNRKKEAQKEREAKKEAKALRRNGEWVHRVYIRSNDQLPILGKISTLGSQVYVGSEPDFRRRSNTLRIGDIQSVHCMLQSSQQANSDQLHQTNQPKNNHKTTQHTAQDSAKETI